MAFLHNIGTVAKYEAKTLRRSWFFRLFSTGTLFILFFMNMGLFSPVGDNPWQIISISSSIPLINLYLLNIGQAIIVIFLAADFLKRDKKLDTNEVLYTRSMSNLEYITGKTIGILRLFLGLDLVILSIGFVMNIISKSMTIDFMSYISYLLIICVPTLLFSLGLAFLMMLVIRNQAITFLLLLGIAALNMFWLWFRMGSIFDYMAFGIPIFKSGIIGFDDLQFIITQRLFFLFLGLSFVLLSVLLFRRLPQSRLHSWLTIFFLIIFTSGAGYCGFNIYTRHIDSSEMKTLVIETNKKFEKEKFTNMISVFIDLAHEGKRIKATADIKIRNDNSEPVDRYLFSLNPSLNVLNVKAGSNLKFTKTNHIIEIFPGKVLEPGDTDSITISYEGTINEAFCYPDYSDNIKEVPYRIAMVNINKRQAFLTDDYVLLTPETHWYPVTSLNYYPTNPARIKIDFSMYTLRVKEEQGLTAVSQGSKISVDGHSIFKSENPLTGITMAIGDYRSDTLVVDSVSYLSYYFRGNDYYKKHLGEIKDTLPDLVSGIMRDLETNFSTKYPFRSLSLVEVPVQFHSFSRECTNTRAEVQPAMVLLPERLSTLENAGFEKQFSRQKTRMERNNQVITDKELQVRLFNSFIRNTFIDGENFRFRNGVAANEPVRYRLGPSFYFFKNNFYSSDYPVINAVFESHLQQINLPGQNEGSRESGTLSDNDKANLILKEMSFNELLKKDPSGDTIRTILSVKGDWLFNLLRSKAGIEEFNTWFSGYINENVFKNVDILKFNKDISDQFGFEFYPYLKDWFYGKTQPGFLFTNLEVNEIIIVDRSRFQVTFTAYNPEPVPGLFNVAFRTGQSGQRGTGQEANRESGRSGNRSSQGRGMEASDITKIVLLGPGETRKIGIVVDFPPRAMIVNTLYSKNIPGQITLPLNDVIRPKIRTKTFTGEETIASIPYFTDASQIIVDNEDSAFILSKYKDNSPLKKLLGISSGQGKSYSQVSIYNTPEHWQPIVQTSYYGKYIRSSVYTRAGKGDKNVSWYALIKEPGYYNIYCYIGKAADRMRVRTNRGAEAAAGSMDDQSREETQFKDMHYKIYHDEGVEEITLDYENADGGWNSLGRFYLSADTSKVVLTNQSEGKAVIGDAIKWEKQD